MDADTNADNAGDNHGGADTNIRVAVRCRPFNSKERANAEQSIVRIYPDQIILTNPANSGEEHKFGFDILFGCQNIQSESRYFGFTLGRKSVHQNLLIFIIFERIFNYPWFMLRKQGFI